VVVIGSISSVCGRQLVFEPRERGLRVATITICLKYVFPAERALPSLVWNISRKS
jgi:hypothetical protein